VPDDHQIPDAAARTSSLAVASVVVALLPGCPPANLAGVVMGTIAMRRIRQAPHRLRGRRLARTAMIGGWLSTMLWCGGWWWASAAVQGWMAESMTRSIESTLRESAERPQSVHDLWSREGEHPTVEELRAFGETVRTRYGRLDSITVSALNAEGTVSRPVYTVALVLHFDGRRRLIGSAEFRSTPGTLQVRLRRLVVADPDLGDLVLDGGSPPPTPNP
jgi:hypothetical protein